MPSLRKSLFVLLFKFLLLSFGISFAQLHSQIFVVIIYSCVYRQQRHNHCHKRLPFLIPTGFYSHQNHDLQLSSFTRNKPGNACLANLLYVKNEDQRDYKRKTKASRNKQDRCISEQARLKHNNDREKILCTNGYTEAFVDETKRNIRISNNTNGNNNNSGEKNWIYLHVPYISDAIDNTLKRL